MTRALAELLGHSGPGFHLHLQQLERSAGLPSHDIRLTTEVLHTTQSKLRSLGLAPHDTRGEELYGVLGARLAGDEQRFSAALRANSTDSDDPIAHVAVVLKRELSGQQCFAMKPVAARRLLKANMPKKTMKALGYRSADSMLKHESVAGLYAAATLVEGDVWTKKMLTAYGKLRGSDFESRPLKIEHPVSKRWQSLAESVVARRRHNIVAFKEIGAIVLLPLPENRPEFITLTTATLTLHAANDIFAAGTYLRLHLVQPNFGVVVRQIAAGEPELSASLLDKPVAWSTAQRYFARVSGNIRADLFEPVLHMEDFVWHRVDDVLARIEPTLEFWKGGGHVAMLDSGKPVSCNLTDALLSHCNRLPYAQRVMQYFRHELSSELSLRYLDHDRLASSIASQFEKVTSDKRIAAAPAAV